MRKPLPDNPLEVLVADPWPSSREVLLSVVRRAGHAVEGVGDAGGAVRMARARRPAVVVVDVKLADADGWALVAQLRDAWRAAVVVAVGPDDGAAAVRALDAGCDDYLARPVPAGVLAARIGAALRLLRRLGGARAETVYDDGLVRIDAAQRRVDIAGREVPLTPLEFRLLSALVRHRDRVMGRDELLEATWHRAPSSSGDHVKLYVHYLRRKLGQHTSAELIRTVRGFGYRWVGRQEDDAGNGGALAS